MHHAKRNAESRRKNPSIRRILREGHSSLLLFRNGGFSVDDREAGVLLQALRHADTLGSLVVLEQGSQDARQGESRAIERVAEVSLLVLTTIAALEAIGLISVEVAD